MFKRILSLLLVLLLLSLPALSEALVDGNIAITDELLVEYGYDYYTPDEVALYLHAFVELPPNFLTKDEARALGWSSQAGNLWEVAYGMCIGGDRFGNREGLLPEARGRDYYECDVNYDGGYRGGERLVFSNDGLIYYTADHYADFDLIYSGWYDETAEYESFEYRY